MTKILLLALLITVASAAPAKETPQSDEAIRQAVIAESIASYPGRCPCPYNTAKNGSSCGARSAYSRPGGRSPLCYPKDVSDEKVRQYRDQRR